MGCIQCSKIHFHKKTNKMENLWHKILANLFAHQYTTKGRYAIRFMIDLAEQPMESSCKTLPMWKKFDAMVHDYFFRITLADLVNGSLHI